MVRWGFAHLSSSQLTNSVYRLYSTTGIEGAFTGHSIVPPTYPSTSRR